jgi:hypothetical protein
LASQKSAGRYWGGVWGVISEASLAKKTKAKKTYKVRGRPKRKRAPTKSWGRHVYDPQTGRIGGRAAHAQSRLEALTKKYQDDGLPLEEARQRARAKMRDNPRGDWRDG